MRSIVPGHVTRHNILIIFHSAPNANISNIQSFAWILANNIWQVVASCRNSCQGEKFALGMYNDLYVCNCAPT